MIGNGFPCIPKKLLTKIVNWEFVDLSELLTASNPMEAISSSGLPSARFSVFLVCEVVRHCKHQITNTTNWCLAFVAYAAAIITQHPSASLELVAYMTIILKASQQYVGLTWRAYDTHYPTKAAASRNLRWSQLDTDLFTRFFTGRACTLSACSICDSISHTALCPEAPSQSPSLPPKAGKAPLGGGGGGLLKRRKLARWPATLCRDYNTKGACAFGTLCKFRHVCGHSWSNHCWNGVHRWSNCY